MSSLKMQCRLETVGPKMRCKNTLKRRRERKTLIEVAESDGLSAASWGEEEGNKGNYCRNVFKVFFWCV